MSKKNQRPETESMEVVALTGNHIEARKRAQAGKSALADVGAKIRNLANLKMGSETIRTPEMIDAIVMRLLDSETMLSISTDPDMPALSTLHEWMKNDRALASLLDWARSEGTHGLVDAQLDIAQGGTLSTGDTERDAMLIKAIQYVASKRNRAAFGDKVEVQKTTINYTVNKTDSDW